MDKEESRERWSQAWPLTGDYLHRLNAVVGFFRQQATYPGAAMTGPTWDELDDFLRLVLVDGLDVDAAALLFEF